LGIELKNADGSMRGMDDVLDDYADAIMNAGSEQEQLRLAFKAFDSEGAALVNLFRKGSLGVQQFRDEINKLGGVIDEDAIRQSEEWNDELNKLTTVLSAELKTALSQLMPIVIELAEGLLWVVDATKQAWAAFKDLLGIVDKQEASYARLTKHLHSMVAEYNTLNNELSTMDWSTPEAQAHVLQMEILNEAIRETSAQLLPELNTQVITITGSMKGASVAIDEASAALDAFGGAGRDIPEFGAWEEAIKDVGETTKDVATESEVFWTTMIENVQGAWADSFYDIFKTGKTSFKDLVATVWDMFLRLIAEMAAKWAAAKIFGGGGGGIMSAVFGSGGSTGMVSAMKSVSSGASSMWASLSGGGGAAAGLGTAGGTAGVGTGAATIESLGAAAGSQGTMGATLFGSGGSSGLVSGIGAVAIPLVAFAAVAAVGFKLQADHAEHRNRVTQEFLAQQDQMIGGFQTTAAIIHGTNENMETFASTINQSAEETRILESIYKGVGAEIDYGNDGLLRMRGRTEEVLAVTKDLDREALDGLQKRIKHQAQLNANMGDGVIRIHDTEAAMKKVTDEFIASTREADNLTSSINSIPTEINTKHTITTSHRNAEGSNDSFASGTGGYRTVPYDGYSPTLHKGEQFNVIPTSKVGSSAPSVSTGGNETNTLLRRQLQQSEETGKQQTAQLTNIGRRLQLVESALRTA